MQAKNRTLAGALGPIHLQGCEKQAKSSEEFNSGVYVYQGSAEFEFGVDVFQGSVLNSLLFIIV